MATYLETLDAFNEKKNTQGGKLIVIDFTATWCPPCQGISPLVGELAEAGTASGEYEVYKVDGDKNPEACEAISLEGFPTFKFYKDGAEVDQMVGANKDKLKELIAKHK